MATLRPLAARAAALRTIPSSPLPAVRRAFTTTPRRAGGGGMQYDPPTGWLWGVRPGEKYQNEGWEGLFIYGFMGSLVVFGIAYAWKPDTSIQTWALEEARRRLEKEGILPDPDDEKKDE
ncbi:ESSS subunit of NADH:ubiquinone oxidoreductase-domain-containing protein [Staphylotrichum tortipilum]|uniref:NADH dehydrogenase [ubiquinone] 1 beta subcomplex subunit 11, mitochondrial n=1 Tax=Staphylotrichum tortipilum TaxID=2831512 RepID=A0AAN6MHG4_9PEZI|nr:ESSS subunit of NADH:ubiquinone oxidoreductase-domain-containing protein [Staphylotrichum longicolle]